MSKTIAALVLTFVVVLAGFALAEEPSKKEASPAQKAHRERMSTCSKDAKQQALKGAERKAFMKQCLSGGSAAAAPGGDQPSQTAACRKDARAKGLKGEERKKFISDCLSSQTGAAQ
jgi:hypothetical protein